MARASKVATKPKKKTVRAVRRGVNRFALAPTDDWNKAKHYVHYEIESKEWLTKVKDYIKKHYDKTIVANVNKLPDWKIGGGSHWACTAFLLEANPKVVPFAYASGIHDLILKLAEEGTKLVEEKKTEEKTKKNVYVPTIQERIFEQAQAACEAIEEWLDGSITNKKTFDSKGFDFTTHFSKMKVSQAHARKIKSFYLDEYEEAQLIQNIPTSAQINRIKDEREKDYTEQIREGYGHIKKAEAKSYLEALENIMSACDMIIDSAKANRKPKTKKTPSKEKLIAKVKYKDRDDKYQIVSVNPLELIEATEVWVFNIKTRKLGKYVADEYQKVMSVKGTSLVGYDESKSIQKTLRKPEETLKEFKSAGKIKLRKFLEEINTMETKLNGRLNDDTVILKTYN